MRRCLLVLDMDLPGLGEELDLEPINYLAARHEQERGEVVVLSVVANRQVKLSPLELLLGAATTAPQPGHGVHAAAEHRMNLAVRHLKAIGYRASGLISDEELVKAVRAETRAHDYDEVILVTGRQGGTRRMRGLHLDPLHQLRQRWGQRLVIFAAGPGTKPGQ